MRPRWHSLPPSSNHSDAIEARDLVHPVVHTIVQRQRIARFDRLDLHQLTIARYLEVAVWHRKVVDFADPMMTSIKHALLIQLNEILGVCLLCGIFEFDKLCTCAVEVGGHHRHRGRDIPLAFAPR